MRRGIVCDIDGTMVGGSAGYPSPEVVARFNTAASVFDFVGYATGRRYEDARSLIGSTGLVVPDFWVCELGCDIRSPKGSVLGEADRAAALRLRWAEAPLSATAWRHGCIAVETYTSRVCFRFASLGRALAFRRELTTAEFVNVLTSPDSLGMHTIDILPAGGGKASGIRIAIAALSLPSAFIYFGDADNDICALTSAETGYLMPHSPDRVRRSVPRCSVLLDAGLEGIISVIEKEGA